jgi:tRNA dimethylallyltransferase
MADTSPEHGSPIIPVLAGPTAVGKTEISLQIAEVLHAEIISADSRQVYRELNIGTAKPGLQELTRIRHHFINERSLGEPFSAGIFAREANARIADILGRGLTPLVVGGSTLYLYALLHGLADVPPIPTGVRKQLQERLVREGPESLYQELAAIDPQAAAQMDLTKTQRLVRALEVYHGTGRPLSSYFGNHDAPPYAFRPVVLTREREDLYARINCRVDNMLEAGLIEEVRGLLEKGVHLEENALQTIGYQEPILYLRGQVDYPEMVRLLKRNTRHYAKRQLTWFRRFPDYGWLDLNKVKWWDVLLKLQ